MTLVYGVGINDDPGDTGKNCPYYVRWAAMLRRCYSAIELQRHPAYSDCSVCEEWKTFSNFKNWMKGQSWQGKHLDKDILHPGNRIYAPDKCVFVNAAINRFTTEKKNYAGALPIGVCTVPESGRFRAQCCTLDGRRVGLGTYDTPEQAHRAWRNKKHELACKLAESQDDPRVSAALKSRYSERGFFSHE